MLKRFKFGFGLILALMGLLTVTGKALAQELTENRLIVKFHSFAPNFVRENLHQRFEASQIERLRPSNTVVVKIPAGISETLAKLYQESWWVDYAEVDAVMTALETPNDPLFSSQWGQDKINTPEAWDVASGSSAVQVAILDTGITNNHSDLTSKVDSFVNFTSSSTPYDLYNHGSHVAGIVAAVTNNNLGVAGTGRDTRLQSVKVLNDSGSGYYSWVINGIYWATDNGAEVINMSLGGTSGSTALRNAINYAWSNGVVIAAAAGNSGNTRRHYPAYYANNIAVAATDQNDLKAYFSTYGSWVDVAAPGVSIVSTIPNNDYAFYNGTSMATPHVAGLAALIKDAFPGFSNQQIRDRLEDTADNISGTGFYWAHGRINAAAAVAGVTPSPSPSPSLSPSPSPLPSPSLSPLPSPSPTPTPSPSVSPSPSPSPSPTPEPGEFISTITSHTVSTRWSRWSGGRIDFRLKFRVDSGSSSQVIVMQATDGTGDWSLYRSRTRADVFVNGSRHRTNFSWDDSSEVATVDIGALGVTLTAGDVVEIRNLMLANDTQGSHSSTGQVWDNIDLIDQNTLNFSL